ncbi:MAG: polya polymerase [Deltaproteobacteria bacterium]|nr:MAG: polya polymerase [Deltaproteobacteria bacterium]
MEIITTHLNSDFDSLGAMIGARKLYPQAVCVFPGSQEKNLRNFFLDSSLYAAGFEKAKKIDLEEVTRLILVDVDHPSRIGNFASLIGRDDVEVHLFDHHPPSEGSIVADYSHVERVGAATTLMVEILKERRLPIEPAEATMMLMGIFEDTGGLTFSTTTPRDFYAAGYLLSQGADPTAASNFLTPEMTAAQVALLDQLLKNRRVERVKGVEVTVASASVDEYIGDVAFLAHRIRDMENIDALIIHVRMEDRVLLVARSRTTSVDVSVVAKHFGGGGHHEAASATIHDMTPIQVDEELAKILPNAVKARVSARDIMTSPVKSVEASSTLGEVRALFNRYQINAAPVMKDGEISGVITRMVVERALGHGLSGAKAEEYMSSEFSTVTPRTGFDTLRELIISGRQRFLPVTEGKDLVGAITRTDILHVLTGEDSPIERVSAKGAVRHARRLLEELVDKEAVTKLREAGKIAQTLDMEAYLVGGMVRDLLLRESNIDVDLVIEGDGINFAREAGRCWGAEVVPHTPFATAKIIFQDGFCIDVATARTEFYESPAALPTVEESSLKLDLKRRDFTINTLAMSLAPDNFGEVLDFFGGLRDIKERSIRILHNLSFVEDPTRVLRALRFSLRFGFSLGAQTEKLLKSAIEQGFFAQGRGPRLFRELKLLLEVTSPGKAIDLLAKYNCLETISPKLTLGDNARERLRRVDEVVAWFGLLYLGRELKGWRIYLLALLEDLTKEEVRNFAAAFNIEQGDGGALIGDRESSGAILLSLRSMMKGRTLPDKKIYRALNGRSDEAILYAMIKTRDEAKRRALSRYYTHLAGVSTHLDGDDLVSMGVTPGPIYRDLLEGLLDAKFDGDVVSREDEVAWIMARLEKNGVKI